jgi:hypothetical protein
MNIGRQSLLMTVVLLLGPSAATALAQDDAAATKPPVVAHELEGRSECLMCHSGTMEEMPAVPESHEGRENGACLWCHAGDAAIQTAEAAKVPHELEGREECSMCHSSGMEGMPQSPADHEGRPNDSCALCHEPSA